MKEIKNYLHLYLGCEVQYEYLSPYAEKPRAELRIGWLTKINTNQDCCIQHIDKNRKEIHAFTTSKPHGFKLILRNLSDMTEEDLKGWITFCQSIGLVRKIPSDIEYESAAKYVREHGLKGIDFNSEREFVPFNVVYLLSKNFDLFGLIEAGLAIDKTKIEQP